jgi:four helix bundle protein
VDACGSTIPQKLQNCRIAESEGSKAKRDRRAARAAARTGTPTAAAATMDKTAEDLKVRTKRFATGVLKFVDTLPRTPGGETIARQLARAGAGVAGNYRSACRARSHTEFTARMGIVLDESDESELWLSIANDSNIGNPQQRVSLAQEAGELRAIFSKAYTTARQRERGAG